MWEDPWKKPCYLFALVAGDLALSEDKFKTMSGREVTLRIYVQAKNLGKVDHAMVSLKHAMKWDEDTFGAAPLLVLPEHLPEQQVLLLCSMPLSQKALPGRESWQAKKVSAMLW